MASEWVKKRGVTLREERDGRNDRFCKGGRRDRKEGTREREYRDVRVGRGGGEGREEEGGEEDWRGKKREGKVI